MTVVWHFLKNIHQSKSTLITQMRLISTDFCMNDL